MLSIGCCVVNGVSAAHKANGLTTKIAMLHFTAHMLRTFCRFFLRGWLRLWKVSVGYPAVQREGASRPPMLPAPDPFAQKLSWESVAHCWGSLPRPSRRRPCASAVTAQQQGARASPPQTSAKTRALCSLCRTPTSAQKRLCRGFLCVKNPFMLN